MKIATVLLFCFPVIASAVNIQSSPYMPTNSYSGIPNPYNNTSNSSYNSNDTYEAYKTQRDKRNERGNENGQITATDRHYLSDNDVKQLIIESEISAFQGECACPYMKTTITLNNIEGTSTQREVECGDNSEYYKADQAQKIHCYPDDLTESDVYNYRMLHNIPDKSQPWMMFPRYRK